MSYKDLNAALRQVIADNTYFGLTEANWQSSPNVDLSGSEPKARVSFTYNQPVPAELGANNSEDITGFMQIDLYYPSSEGDAAINTKAQEIKEAYASGRLVYNNTNVRVISSGINTNPTNEQGWYTLFIQVDFSSFFCQ